MNRTVKCLLVLSRPRRPYSPTLFAAFRHIATFSITQALADLSERKTNPSTLLASCLDELATHNSKLNAVVDIAPSADVESKAQQADQRWAQGKPKGSLDGIPIVVKANICTKTLTTTCASKMLDNFTSPNDATVIKHLRDSGAIIIAKANMDEFGMGSANIHSTHGPAYNPCDETVQRVAGGSSGGSAAAVAANMCFAALGSDTGGSIRTPAAYTGVVGFKPSYGRFSRQGLVAYASSLDTVGVLTKKVKDAEIIYDVLAQYDEKDSTSLPFDNEPTPLIKDLSGIKIGIPKEYAVEGLSTAVMKAWNAAAHHLDERGATIVPVSLPHTKYSLPAYYVIAPAEASSNLARYDGIRYGHRTTKSRKSGTPKQPLYGATRTEGFGDEVQRRIMLGTFVLQANSYNSYFLQAQKLRRLVQKDFDRTFMKSNPLHTAHFPKELESSTKVDFLLTPSAISAAPRVDDVIKKSSETPVSEYVNDVLTIPASLAGLPALAVPFGADEHGLPVGVQILGQYGDDKNVLAIGKILQEYYIYSQ